MFDIKEELKKLPSKPGVYLMKDDKDEIIYVGKAISLKNRVRQYFQSSKNQDAKVATMVSHIKEFEYIVTDSEMEALILECTLIKKHSPHYNILMKDDKMYPYIKVTVNEPFPRIFMTRKHSKDKAKYYGPITDAMAVKQTIDTLHKIWPIRTCNRSLPKEIGKSRPCLNYYIGRCSAPCDCAISQEDYRKIIDEAMQFIEGKHSVILKRMEYEMFQASERLEFEKAAAIRDNIKSIHSINEKQKMSNLTLGDCDVVAFAKAHDDGMAQVFFIRSNQITGRESFALSSVADRDKSEIITEFIKQFYSGTAYVPREIVLQEPLVPEEAALLEAFLSERRGSKVSFTVPQKGEKYKLVELAWKNAIITLEQLGDRIERNNKRTVGAVEEICQTLGLDTPVSRMEAYDISNTQGFESVGSMVVFENGIPKRSDYRKFKIKTVIGANDVASMEEVLDRRLRHAIMERNTKDLGKFSRLPDIILIDGGKGQVNGVKRVLESLSIDIPVCGMIKDDKHRTRGLLYEDKELTMPLNSQGFLLLTRIQDEVHRFAIEYHRKLREKASLHSVLDDIEGIGPVRRKNLMKHFGDIDAISRAEVSDLLEAPGMTIQAAEAVYSFFR